MAHIQTIIDSMNNQPKNISFKDLCKVCDAYFGRARQTSSSHRAYKMPWTGDPRVNIQNKKGKAKPYQVKIKSSKYYKPLRTSRKTMLHKAQQYRYSVIWSEDDQSYIGLCAEFPSLSWLEDTAEMASQGIRNIVLACINDMQAQNEPIPQPQTITQPCDDKITVRLTPRYYQESNFKHTAVLSG